jgi:poly-gamma-glutamate synthesis protein (capsule biosynthesis protein)
MKPTTPSRRALWLALLVCLGLATALFAACGDATLPEVTATPTRTPRPTLTPTPSPTPTPAWPVTVYVPQELPDPVADALNGVVTAHPEFFAPVSSAMDADVVAAFDPNGESATPVGSWVYAVVAPFPTLTDEVAWSDVLNCWKGNPSGLLAGRPLLMDADTQTVLAALLGPAAEGAIFVVPAEQLLDTAWANRPAWAIVPFDQLQPRWKVLRVDGVSVLDKSLDTAAYPLVVRAGLTGSERGIAKLLEFLERAPLTNRDPAKMVTILMTGVTALTRGTAVRMETNGVLYPAQDIRDWLLDADLTHISNEVSFAETCPPPANNESVVFCASPRYIELIEDADIDVIELTGNHLLDWGVEAMELSLSMYDERGIRTYGGGWDLAQAQMPLTVTVNGYTFAFVGCNPAGPPSDYATEDRPGSAPCDFGLVPDQLGPQVQQLREQGIIPIVTLQYLETYSYAPTDQQRVDFRALSAAGAAIVSGSQAHQPQGFDFEDGAFIHYGLGNLFFDQMWSLETRQEFLDRHVFYDGRHISTEVLTAILEDYARPRPMTVEERQALLSAAFAASGW